MYLRYTTREKDGKVHRSWRLVRSVRIGRRVIQQTVAHLGELAHAGRLRARALARALIGEPEHADLFDDGTREQTIGVRLKGVRIANGRAFGDVYLALALWHACRLDEFSAVHLPAGKEEVPWQKMAAVLVAARLCQPSSELHLAEDWYRRTALSDLLQLNDALVNKDRLYRALDCLLPHKAALEAHRSRRVGELLSGRQRGAALRRHLDLLRRRGRRQGAGPARLLARSPARLQAGVHRPGGHLRWLSARLRSVPRQHA
jgi:hypothetical protein